MKRTLARFGLAGMLVGVPTLLLSLGFDPRWPKFSGSLSDTYLPLDEILQVLALAIWIVWAYASVVTLLRACAVIVSRRGDGGERLLGVTSLLAPGPLRRLIDFAVGGAFVAASLSVNVSSPSLAAPRPAAAIVDGAGVRESANVRSVSQPAARVYRVLAGDSLWRIAERELGSGYEWRRIFDLNRGKTFDDGRRLTNPRLIHPGWTLELPTDAHHARSPVSRAGTTRNGNGKAKAISPATTRPFTVASTPNIPERSTNANRPAAEVREESRQEEPVLRLPSGALVAASFASGLLTAELLGRLRRRRRWRLSDAESTTVVEDPPIVRDLRHAGGAPNSDRMGAALEAVCQAWRTSTGTWPCLQLAVEERERITVIGEDSEHRALPQPSGGTVGPSVQFARSGSVVRAEVGGPFAVRMHRTSTALELALSAPLGRTRDGAAVHVAALGAGGLAVTGSRAADLIRQFVLALAAPASPEELHITLLGAEMLGIDALPQVRRSYGWDAAEEALQDLQQEFVARARVFLDAAEPDIWTHLASRPDERLPAIVIVSGDPPAALKRLVEAVGRQSPSLGGALIAVGWKPEGVRAHALANDSLELETHLPCPKLAEPFLLDVSAAAQAIDVIRMAWPQDDSEAESELERGSDGHDDGLPQDAEPLAAAEEVLPQDPPEEAPSTPLTEAADERVSVPPPPTFVSSEPSPDVPAVHCLGAFEVTRGTRRLGKGWRKKSKEILAYLIAHPDGASKDRIVDALWPEATGPEGEASFLRRVSELRQYVRGRQDSRVYVERNGETYRLESEVWSIDAIEMDRLVAEATHCPDPDRAEEMLRRAVTLYRGEFCADEYYSWLEPARERYRVLFLRGLSLLADLVEGRGEHEEALSVIDQAIAIDPLCEDLWRRAMTIEAARGRRAVALRRYHRLEAILEKEIDVDPDPETQALAQQLGAAN